MNSTRTKGPESSTVLVSQERSSRDFHSAGVTGAKFQRPLPMDLNFVLWMQRRSKSADLRVLVVGTLRAQQQLRIEQQQQQ
ncbi:unnamed protein product [Lampetra fluviatilis]